MGSRKSAPPPPDPQIAIRAEQERVAAEQRAAAEAQAQAAAKIAAEKAAKDKAIQGGESAEDIAAREQSTLANPKKQKVRGRRSLVSATSLGSGVGSSREQLG